jgi:hypothetical protein
VQSARYVAAGIGLPVPTTCSSTKSIWPVLISAATSVQSVSTARRREKWATASGDGATGRAETKLNTASSIGAGDLPDAAGLG